MRLNRSSFSMEALVVLDRLMLVATFAASPSASALVLAVKIWSNASVPEVSKS